MKKSKVCEMEIMNKNLSFVWLIITPYECKSNNLLYSTGCPGKKLTYFCLPLQHTVQNKVVPTVQNKVFLLEHIVMLYDVLERLSATFDS